jgi:sortase A
MKDRRLVDDLTIEELEQVLRIKKRQARMERLRSYEQTGRRLGDHGAPEEVRNPDEEESAAVPYESFLNEETEHGGKRKRNLRDHLLLAVEIAAALGLAAILVFTAMSFRELNEEAASARAEGVEELPTASPTPLISAIVLPGGHIVMEDGSVRPNLEEVPPHLRPLVEQSWSAPPVVQATPMPGYAVRIRIPALGVDSRVMQGLDLPTLNQGVVGQLPGTPIPGQNGNIVLAGHNDVYGEVFRDLPLLEPGDEIIIQNSTLQEFVYRVSYSDIVEPDKVSVMDQTPDPIVTLISCYPILVNTHRIVVVAELVEP